MMVTKLIFIAAALVLLAIVVGRVLTGRRPTKRPPRRLRDRQEDIDEADFTEVGPRDE